jgi:hypothetical protein
MSKKNMLQSHCDDTVAFNRRFKYAVIAFAIIEFIVVALVFIYKANR